jgi:hypothetical protein
MGIEITHYCLPVNCGCSVSLWLFEISRPYAKHLKEFIQPNVHVILECLLIFDERELGSIIPNSEYFPIFQLVAFRTMTAADIDASATRGTGLDKLAGPVPITEVLQRRVQMLDILWKYLLGSS